MVNFNHNWYTYLLSYFIFDLHSCYDRNAFTFPTFLFRHVPPFLISRQEKVHTLYYLRHLCNNVLSENTNQEMSFNLKRTFSNVEQTTKKRK